MNIKVQLFKLKQSEKEKALKPDSEKFSEHEEDNIKPLTDLEYLSHFEDVQTFREISDGLTEASIDFNDLPNNKDHLNYKNILSNKLSITKEDLDKITYRNLLGKLILLAENNYRKYNMLSIKQMPILKCIKKLSSGSYGTAFVIKKWKENEKNKFQLEDEKRDLKNKYYVLKSCYTSHYNKLKITHPELNRRYQNEKNINYCLFHPNIAEFYGCYFTQVQILFISEYLCFDRFIRIFYTEQKFKEKLNKRTIKFIAAQLLLGNFYINYLYS